MFDSDDLWADVRGPTREAPVCGPCKRERDELVEMRAEESWQPGVVVDVWRCPDCGTEVGRGDVPGERFI